MIETNSYPDDKFFDFLLESRVKPCNYEDLNMYELNPYSTNLPTLIMLDDHAPYRNPQYHTPIVLVAGIVGTIYPNYQLEKLIPVAISKEPKTLLTEKVLLERSNMTVEEWDSIFSFISRNYDVLMAHWNGTLEKEYGVEDVSKVLHCR